MRILIVDDAAIERAIFARIALALGHEIAGETGDLEMAVQLAGRLAPDLIVVDGRLPPLGGPGAVAMLRSAAPQSALALVLALGELDLVRAGRAAGAAAILRRPLLATQVEAALRGLVR